MAPMVCQEELADQENKENRAAKGFQGDQDQLVHLDLLESPDQRVSLALWDLLEEKAHLVLWAFLARMVFLVQRVFPEHVAPRASLDLLD